jgi:HemY protein
MLWSLVRIVLFIVLIALLAITAGVLLETGGGIRVALAGWEFTLGPLATAIAAVALVIVVWLLMRILGLLGAVLRFLNGDDTALSRYFDRNRERRGFDALADGMLAVASGEGRLAMSRAAKAERLLKRPELTNLLQAQAAEAAGDRAAAQEAYKRLLGDSRTRFVGVRGLLQQKLAEGDTGTALQLAQRAFALKPRHEETQDILLKLQAADHDWTGARATLGAKLRTGTVPRDVFRRRDALLALSEAKEVLNESNPIEAREAAIEANRLSPDLIPAAAMAARSYIAAGKPRYAARVLKKAWQAQPHPDLAAAFAEIDTTETPEARLKRFQALTALRPEHEETRLLLAELHIAAEDFPGARRSLGDLATTRPTQRTLTVMAAIERGEGADDRVVRGWLARALSAPRGPQWVCENCHNIQSDWTPICDNCGALDTLSWTEPTERDATLPHQAQMLPLIVGVPEREVADLPHPPEGTAGPAADEPLPPEPDGREK